MVPIAATGTRRFLLHQGVPVPVPSSPAEMLRSPLLSLAGRMRMVKEPFVPRREAVDDESVAAFVRRRFGDEVASRFFEPLISATSGADPEQVLVRYAMPKLVAQEQRAGSILKAQLRAARDARRNATAPPTPPHSWPGGLGTMVARLAGTLAAALHLDTAVAAVTPHLDGVELVELSGHQHRFDAVVLALPAVALGALRFPASLQDQLAPLASMPHASPVTVSLGYRRDQVRHPLDGFGVLVPATERRRVLGLQFTSSLFPDRAPTGHVLLTVTLGGARQPAHLALADDALVEMAMEESAELLGIEGAPVHASVQRWPAALPLAVAGHGARLGAARVAEEMAPRLAFTGAWRAGSSLGEVMEGGVAAAERLLADA
jgi:oxygen-dependent protoporphyrinogen oxidase